MMSEHSNPLTPALVDALSKALENMAFEEIELVDDQLPKSFESASDHLWAILPILEPVYGEVGVSLSSDCAQMITESIYGASGDDELAENTIHDALGEILNTVVGRFIHALIPADQRFDFGLPRTGTGEFPIPIERVEASVSIDASGHTLTAIVVGKDFLELAESLT